MWGAQDDQEKLTREGERREQQGTAMFDLNPSQL